MVVIGDPFAADLGGVCTAKGAVMPLSDRLGNAPCLLSSGKVIAVGAVVVTLGVVRLVSSWVPEPLCPLAAPIADDDRRFEDDVLLVLVVLVAVVVFVAVLVSP